MPSIGKDLATIRNHLRLTLQDIQHSTKIPLDTLQSIEKGTIFQEGREIKTYVRSFVRSYAKALKIDHESIVKALDQEETGNYNHILLQEFPELRNKIPNLNTEPGAGEKDSKDTNNEDSEVKSSKEQENIEKVSTPEKEKSDSTNKPVKKATPKKPDPVRSPKANQVDWADVGKRINREKKKTPIWLISFLILLILSGIIGYFIYEGEYFSFNTETATEEVPRETTTEPEGPSLDMTTNLSNEELEDNAAETSLDDTLFITVYAAFDRVDPVRIWSDLKPRNDPYWLDEGIAMMFEFENTIRINGPYDRFLLFMNGHLIENFQQNYFNEGENAVELNRDQFTSDPKWATPVDLDLPQDIPTPDSVDYRPTF